MLTLLIHIGQNIALLFALTYGYSLLWSPLKRLEHLNHYLYSVTIGALFGIIAGLGMLDPIVLYPGFFLDGRTVMITLVGVIEGPVAALLTTILVIFVRWEIGGSGTFFGIATAVTAVFIGWAGRVYLKGNLSKARSGLFLALGAALIVSGGLWALMFPDIDPRVTPLSLPSLLATAYYPLATLLLGELLVYEIRRQRTQSALAESEIRFSKVFAASPVAISISRLQGGQFVEVNEAFLKLTGFSREELIGHTINELGIRIHPDERDSLVKAIASGKMTYPHDRTIRNKSGLERSVQFVAERIDLGGEAHILSLASDISDRRKAEAALESLNAQLEQRIKERTSQVQQEQMFLQTIMNSMGEGVMYSSNFVILYVNRALEDLTGYTAAELIGKPNSILKSERASLREARLFHEELAEGDSMWRGEVRIRRKDSSEFQAELIVRRILDQYDLMDGAVTLVRDITVEKDIQAQKTRFIANASHELRTPLTNLITRLYLLQKQPEQSGEHLAVIERVAHQMSQLVEELLDTARFESGVVSLKFGDVLLQDLVKDVVSLQQPEAQARNITVTTTLPPVPLHTHGDELRLRQVVTNLITNAIHYTAQGGRITVLLEEVEEGHYHLAKLHVTDTGIGIRSEDLPRIFEAFFRAEEEAAQGTGLGLPISREIVELHGGKLTVESEIGVGSTFCVHLLLTATNGVGADVG